MANAFRYRSGDTKPVMAPVDSATVINIGDMVGLHSGKILPASDTEWAGSDALFHDSFLGIAAQASRDGDTADVRVDTAGDFEMDTASASYALGALLKPYDAGATLADQQVAAADDETLAIGRCAKATSSATKVLVRIVSAVMDGGTQASA